MKTTAQLINQNSGKTRYYTPDYILDTAALVMGEHFSEHGTKYRFELDPASDEYGNNIVKAERYFTEDLDGLIHAWTAKSVWMNHPYARDSNNTWITKAVHEYLTGNAKQICLIVWASTSEKWFHPLFQFPICFLDHRVKFIDPDRKLPGATKSSAVVYMGPHKDRFYQRFGKIGNVVVPPSLSMTNLVLIHGLAKIRQLVDKMLEQGDKFTSI